MEKRNSFEKSGSSFFMNLSDDVLIEIFVRVPAIDIVRNCVLVSKQLHHIVASSTLWRHKCELEGKFVSGKTPFPNDFKKLYFFHPYTRNLIKNPCAAEKLEHWKVIQNGGDQFEVQSEAIGSQNISETDMVSEWTKTPIKLWATSFGVCEKKQVVDLVAEGADPVLLDETSPPICVSEWIAARFDCACHYEISVKLLSGNKEVIDKFEYEEDIPQWTSGEWKKIQHTFRKYKPGLRFIEFGHLGHDNQSWGGNYGPKFTLSTVRFDFD